MRGAAIRSALAYVLAMQVAGCAALSPKPLWELPPPPIAEGPVVPAARLHRAALENGVAVIVLEDHALPRLSIGVVTRRGADSESLAEAGVTDLTVEVMKRGAGSRDALALARAVEEMGASLSASAGWDSASAGVGGLSEDADALFGILADVVRRPRFEPGEVARARAEQLAALEREKDEPHAVAARVFARVLYDGHRYGISSDGAAASLARLDAAALRRRHASLFTPAQSIVYVVGDIGNDDAMARLRTHFGDWPARDGIGPGVAPPATTPPARRVVVIDRPDQQQATLMLGHEGIARTDPTRIAATLTNDILGGGGFLSRLMTLVRAEHGLVYGVSSAFATRRYPGPFVVSTSTRVAEAGRVVDLLLGALEGMRSNPPGEVELRNAKSYAAGNFVLGLETSAAIAGSLVDLEVHGLPPDSLDTFRTRLAAVNDADVAATAVRLLHPDRVAIIAVGPAAELRSQLERFGPVEIAEP